MYKQPRGNFFNFSSIRQEIEIGKKLKSIDYISLEMFGILIWKDFCVSKQNLQQIKSIIEVAVTRYLVWEKQQSCHQILSCSTIRFVKILT